MYLGEIVRLCLLKLIEAKALFDGKMPLFLKNNDSFYTKYVSEMERCVSFFPDR